MGFRVAIEAEYRSEILCNIHPEGKPSGGKAVFAFLSGLMGYAFSIEDQASDDEALKYVHNWYRQVEALTEKTFLPTCQPLLDCMWGDGGDPTEFREDEYEFYLHRAQSSAPPTETQFRELIRSYDRHWKPITEVIQGVQLLLEMFEHSAIEPLEGFYVAEDTIPDFEALEANLHLLEMRHNSIVRLNFS